MMPLNWCCPRRVGISLGKGWGNAMDRFNAALSAWAPQVQSILRIMAGLLFLQHGLVKFFGFPIAPQNYPAMFTLLWFAGIIETVGGSLLTLGLFTRFAALFMSGEMAVAYWMMRPSRGFFPIQNGGNLEVIYCFVFFYFIFAGPGPWSLDAKRTPTP
jgi:putative oxidoreductase